MRNTDVVIVGGGLAGSIAAAVLGGRGIDAVLIDPHPVYPSDLRCEKVSREQLAILNHRPVEAAIKAAAAFDDRIWIARFGRVIDRKSGNQYGLLYDALVGAARSAIPEQVPFLTGKAAEISTGADRQEVLLADGERISARLVIMAHGLNLGLQHRLGGGRKVLSANHSITVGFDLAAPDGGAFPFQALTYYAENVAARMAYLTLFPTVQAMRANLFVYRDLDDPWLRLMRREPEAALAGIMPKLARVTGAAKVAGTVRIRPVDLYASEGHRQAGVVLVGDAFATSCPAAGTGATKVFMDVARLCQEYVPAWLRTPGMSAEKISAFYDDPQKVACDARSLAKAYSLRATSTRQGALWTGRRVARFAGRSAAGWLRRVRPGTGRQVNAEPPRP